jgi:hypothetical protein
MLTRKNIKSLGFVCLEKDTFINESPNNRDEKIYFGEIYQNKRYITITNNCGQFYFMGWLKNKKQLKRLFEQVGVSYLESI